jgi:hypothetical protein
VFDANPIRELACECRDHSVIGRIAKSLVKQGKGELHPASVSLGDRCAVLIERRLRAW